MPTNPPRSTCRALWAQAKRTPGTRARPDGVKRTGPALPHHRAEASPGAHMTPTALPFRPTQAPGRGHAPQAQLPRSLRSGRPPPAPSAERSCGAVIAPRRSDPGALPARSAGAFRGRGFGGRPGGPGFSGRRTKARRPQSPCYHAGRARENATELRRDSGRRSNFCQPPPSPPCQGGGLKVEVFLERCPKTLGFFCTSRFRRK
jgi:hypothetical protein